jgi:hypothetical protein
MKKLLTSLLFVTLLFFNHVCYARNRVYIETTQETTVIFLDDARAETVRKALEKNPRIEQKTLISSTIADGYVERNSSPNEKAPKPPFDIRDEVRQSTEPKPKVTHVLACNSHGCALCKADRDVTVSTDKSKGGLFHNSSLYETRCITAQHKR